MKTNKILIGTLAGGVSFFFLGWLVYGILLKDFYAANFNQCSMLAMENMVWWAMIVSNLVSAYFLVTILNWSGSSGVMDAFKKSLIIGLLIGLYMDLSFYSMTTTYNSMGAMFSDIVIGTIFTGVVGAIIGWAMGMVGKD